ncbi:MAG: ubiquitin-like small modifier protein 1 [Candidatus Limnocylindria bacterium]
MPNVTVQLHGPFREFAGGTKRLDVDAASVGEALEALVTEIPALAERLRDERGELREHVNVFANSDEMRWLEGERTPLREGDLIHVMPALSGGKDQR